MYRDCLDKKEINKNICQKMEISNADHICYNGEDSFCDAYVETTQTCEEFCHSKGLMCSLAWEENGSQFAGCPKGADRNCTDPIGNDKICRCQEASYALSELSPHYVDYIKVNAGGSCDNVTAYLWDGSSGATLCGTSDGQGEVCNLSSFFKVFGVHD